MYSISRAKKIKDKTTLASLSEHNFRTRTQENIDSARTPLNRLLINSLGINTKRAADLGEKLDEYYEGLGIKARKNNVLMIEFIATASPEFFEGISEKELNKWIEKQIEFFKKEFGDNLKLAICHLDEKSPHIHLTISTEEKKLLKYRNRYATTEKEVYSLNAKRWNPEFFKGFQTRFAENSAIFGLKRGIEGSKKVHKSPGEKISSLKREKKEFIQSWKDSSGKIRNKVLELSNEINDLINDLDKAIGILTEKELSNSEQQTVAEIMVKSQSRKVNNLGKQVKKPANKF